MGGWLGAAPEQLEELGRNMRDAAARLETLRRDVDGMINRLIWEGADSDAFNEQWLSSLSASIIAAETMLDDVANVLMANAQQQREASGETSGFYDGLETVGRVVGGAGIALGVLDTKYLSKYKGAVNGVLGKTPLLHGGLSVEALDGSVGAIGTVISGWSFVHDLSTKPSDKATYNAGVETALGAAGVAAFAAEAFPAVGEVAIAAGVAADAIPVVGEVILGAQIINFVGSAIDPELDKQIVDGVADAGKAVVRLGEDEIKATEAAARVMSSGVHGALSLIHRL